MSIQVAGRTVDGAELPAPGTWTIDSTHSTVGFSVRHLMVAKVRGRFGDFAGTLAIDGSPEDSVAEVTIDMTSIDTRDAKRDAHLRSSDFFDVERNPQATFRSTGLVRTGPSTFDLAGDLTLAGMTRPVTLAVTYEGVTPDPWGGTRAAFSAEAEVDREDFGLTWNQALETGGVVVGKQVKIEIEIEAVLQA